MPTSESYNRIWFETIDAALEAGTDRKEAEESAIATIMVEVHAGRMKINMERAIRAELRKVDEAHGRAADGLLRRIAGGNVPLTHEDLELVVTLGAGRRKTWFYVTDADLDAMNEIRYRNYKSARESFQEFNANVLAVRQMVVDHGTLGAAFEAGAFSQKEEAA